MIEKFFKSKGQISQVDFCQANGISHSQFTHLAKEFIEREYNVKVPQHKMIRRHHFSHSHAPYSLFGFNIHL